MNASVSRSGPLPGASLWPNWIRTTSGRSARTSSQCPSSTKLFVLRPPRAWFEQRGARAEERGEAGPPALPLGDGRVARERDAERAVGRREAPRLAADPALGPDRVDAPRVARARGERAGRPGRPVEAGHGRRLGARAEEELVSRAPRAATQRSVAPKRGTSVAPSCGLGTAANGRTAGIVPSGSHWPQNVHSGVISAGDGEKSASSRLSANQGRSPSSPRQPWKKARGSQA